MLIWPRYLTNSHRRPAPWVKGLRLIGYITSIISFVGELGGKVVGGGVVN